MIERTLPLFENADPQHGLLRPNGTDGVDVEVSPALLDRALRIMNALLLALEGRGFVVEVDSTGATRVLVGDEWIRFGIVERLQQVWPSAKKPPKKLEGSGREWWLYCNRPRMQLAPSGKLILEMKEADIGVQVQWRNGKRLIEKRLNDFVKSLFVVAEAKRSAKQADARWRMSFEEEAHRAQRKRMNDERRAASSPTSPARRESKVLQMLERWQRATDLRQLVDEMKHATIRNGAALPKWVAWAERYASCIDPASRGGPKYWSESGLTLSRDLAPQPVRHSMHNDRAI